MKKIVVSIDALGKFTMKAEGYTGKVCQSRMKPIHDALTNGKPMEGTETQGNFGVTTSNARQLHS